MRRGLPILAVLFWTWTATGDESSGSIEGRVVNGADPIARATVVAASVTAKLVRQTTTGPDGGYTIADLPPGDYRVLAAFGDARTMSSTHVEAGKVSRIDATLAPASELITVHEKVVRPTEPAKLVATTMPKIPDYSDEAMDANLWGLAWLLLSIDEKGHVTAAQFLKRPGLNLEKIALATAWKLRFEPARGASGAPVPSQVLWKMEWPSFWWSREVEHPERHPPPCAGTGPVDMDLVGDLSKTPHIRDVVDKNPVYRDCTPPDASHLSKEPIYRAP